MSIEALNEVLLANLGNRLTPELVTGILAGYTKAQICPLNLEEIPPQEYDGAVFHVARMRDILSELIPLHQKHWEETEGYRHGLELNPDYDRMMYMEDRGQFLVFTLRQDGMLVGNCMMYLIQNTHTQTWTAEEDTIYILPEYRRGRLGVHFVQYAETILRCMGVAEVKLTVKTVNRVTALLMRLGYKHTANQLNKIL